MIVEQARIVVRPSHSTAFEQAVTEAERTVFSRAKGFRSLMLYHCIEQPDVYLLVVEWDSLEAHTVDFREGPLFIEWRALVSPYFQEPPSVLHYQL